MPTIARSFHTGLRASARSCVQARLRAIARGAALAVALGGGAACTERGAAPADSSLTQDLARARDDEGARDLTRAEAAGAQPELHDVSLGAAPAPARSLPAGSSVDRARTPTPAPAPTRPSPSASTPAPSPTTTPASPSTPAPSTPAPSTPAPAPAAATPAAGASAGSGAGLQAGVVATGTVLRLTPHIRVCTNVNSVGDVFETTLTSAVTGTDGATVPAGANVVLRVTGLTRAGDDAVLAFEIVAVGLTRQSFTVTAADAGGAVAGSARSPSEVAKGAGKATAQEVARFGTCVPRDGELTVTLTRGVRLSATE